jgi:hypothetical protein
MDSDLNLQPTAETTNVIVTVLNNNTTVSSIALSLTETSSSSSMFTGLLQLCNTCSAPGSMPVGNARNRTICATYADLSHKMYNCSSACDATGHCLHGCSEITASARACSRISVRATLFSQPFNSNASKLIILLDDADMDAKDTIETAYVNVASYLNTGQLVNKLVALTETGSATGLFTASIMLIRVESQADASCSAPGPNLCCGLGISANIKVSYADLSPAAQLVTEQLIVCDATIRIASSFIPGLGLQVFEL